MKELDEVIGTLTKKRDEEAGGVMQKLEVALHEKQKEEAKAKSTLTNKNDTLKAEQKKLNQLNKQLSNVGHYFNINNFEINRLDLCKMLS